MADYEDDKGAKYLPSRREIKRKAEAIRRGWSWWTRNSRCSGGGRVPWEIPVVAARALEKPAMREDDLI